MACEAGMFMTVAGSSDGLAMDFGYMSDELLRASESHSARMNYATPMQRSCPALPSTFPPTSISKPGGSPGIIQAATTPLFNAKRTGGRLSINCTGVGRASPCTFCVPQDTGG